jgi:hypothetical protein
MAAAGLQCLEARPQAEKNRVRFREIRLLLYTGKSN